MKPSVDKIVDKLLADDPDLKPYEKTVLRRIQKIRETEAWLSHFDGTPYLYFHDGPRGHHVVKNVQ